MRGLFVMFAILGWTAPAFADAKIQELITSYDKEATACHKNADGVTKVATGTASLIDAGEKDLAPDLETLNAGLAKVHEYCDELAATLALLEAPSATYKALEHQLDEHDNKIRKLRQTSKKALDSLAPLLQKLIPKINARVGAAAAPPVKQVPGKFPSGRTVDLPVLPGTWRVSGTQSSDTAAYSDRKLDSSVTVRAFTGATCEQQRKTVKDATDVPPPDATKSLAWYVVYTRGDRHVRVACVVTKTGGLLATIDQPTVEWPSLDAVMLRMIAAYQP